MRVERATVSKSERSQIKGYGVAGSESLAGQGIWSATRAPATPYFCATSVRMRDLERRHLQAIDLPA